jgi:hypothetical protein
MMVAGKTRVVSFRLSERDYQQLVCISNAKGARTLSDIARMVLCSLLDDSDSEMSPTLDKKMAQLDDTIMSLNQELTRAIAVIESALVRAEARPPDADGTGRALADQQGYCEQLQADAAASGSTNR